MRSWEADFEAFMLEHEIFLSCQVARYCNLNNLPSAYREDLFQDAVEQMLRMWEKRLIYEPESHRRASMCLVLQYKAMNAGRRYSTEARHRAPVSLDAAGELFTSGVSAESVAIAEISRLEVYEQVRNLPSLQRTVVELRYLSGISVQEVSRVLEISESAVTSSSHKGLRTLRALLSRELIREFEAAHFTSGKGGVA